MSSIIREGTVVVARMPIREDILNKMDISHQTRPFIIYMVDDFKYYGFSMSSKVKENNPICVCFSNNSSQGWLFKEDDSVYLHRIYMLDDSNILRVVGEISKDEYDNISKVIVSRRNMLKWHDRATKLYEEKYYKEPSYVNGDIVIDNNDKNIYLIYDVNGQKITTYTLNKVGDTTNETLIINNNNYIVDYNNPHYLDKKDVNYSYLSSLKISEFLKTKDLIKSKRKQKIVVPTIIEDIDKNKDYSKEVEPVTKLAKGTRIYYCNEEYIVIYSSNTITYMINVNTYREDLKIEALDFNSHYEIVGNASKFKLLEIFLFLERHFDEPQLKNIRFMLKK